MALYDLDNRIRAFGESRRLDVGTAKKPRWITNVHAGDDYAETYGHDRVGAVHPGVVTFSGWSSTFGWHVKARAPDGTIIGYHSLEEASPLDEGDTVRPGDFVGRTGDSASGANGNHVHIQADTPKGKAFNPRPYISGLSAIGGAVPFDNTEDDMDAEQNRKLDAVYNAIFAGGSSMDDNGRSISKSLAGIVAVVDQIKSKISEPAPVVVRSSQSGPSSLPADGKPVTLSKVQDDADTNSLLRKLEGQIVAINAAVAALAVAQGVDPEQLSTMIAQKVDAALADNFSAIPAAVNDDAAARMKS